MFWLFGGRRLRELGILGMNHRNTRCLLDLNPRRLFPLVDSKSRMHRLCHQIGVPCRVYEAVAALSPLGYGINLQPNAIRELSALGLGEKLAAAGILTKELAFYNKHGQLIWTEPRGRAAGYRWPQISISRGKLHEVLLGAIDDRLGPQALVTGSRPT